MGGKCRPFTNNITNKQYTDTDTTECTPCPALEISQWSQWGEWETVKGPVCGAGEMTRERKRTCLEAKDRTQNCPGESTETKTVPLPACTPTTQSPASENSPATYQAAGAEKYGIENGQDYVDDDNDDNDDDDEDDENDDDNDEDDDDEDDDDDDFFVP